MSYLRPSPSPQFLTCHPRYRSQGASVGDTSFPPETLGLRTARRVVLAIVVASGLSAHALDWHADRGFRWSDLPVAKQGHAGFTSMASDSTGIVFTNILDEASGA